MIPMPTEFFEPHNKETRMLYLRLFEEGYVANSPLRGSVKPRDTDYLRRLYHFNVTAINDYYTQRNFAAKNTNLLSRMLEMVNTDLNNTADRFAEIISSRIPYIGKHFGITSEIEKGTIHNGSFFGRGNDEIVMSVNDYFDPLQVERDWKKSTVLSVYKHNGNDLKLLLPSGRVTGSRQGLCSIGINLPKLAVMYRCFMREQHRNYQSGGEVLNKNFFVFKYVFGKNIEQAIDHSILNRLMDRYYGRSEVLPRFKHPFKIFEPTTQINRFVDNTLDIITKKDIAFNDLLHNIHLMFTDTALKLLLLPEVAGNRQITWALLSSRLEHMCFLLDIAGKSSNNAHYVNDWKKAVKRVDREAVFNGVFSYDVEKDLREKMYKITNW
jgi:hypothetical protein